MNQASRKALLVLTASALVGAFPVCAQSQNAPPTLDPAKKQQQPDQAKPEVTPLTIDNAAPPVNAEEDAAIKVFRDVAQTDVPKKIQTGEDFLQKYPQSRYRSEVYIWLVRGYLVQGQIDKMETAGDKELELNPNDPQTLAILGSTLPRAMNASTPNPTQRLEKSEQYCKKSLDLLPTLPKPTELSDADFAKAKDQTSAMAYGGLGIIAIRRQKFTEAVPNFEQAIKLDTAPDPVNFYLLAIAYQKTSHFDDAVAAYTKCAAIPSGLQATCKSGVDEAKKLGATQLSAPK